MASSLLQGNFSEHAIQTVCDCEQRRNNSTARNALGPFPDESFLSGIDKILCFFGITDVYDLFGYCPLAYDCNYLSTSSMSSLSEVNLQCAPSMYPRLLYKCSISEDENCRSENVSSPRICDANSSDLDYISASSKLDTKSTENCRITSCPPCKEISCKKRSSVTNSSADCTKVVAQDKCIKKSSSRKSVCKQNSAERIKCPSGESGGKLISSCLRRQNLKHSCEQLKKTKKDPCTSPRSLPSSCANSDRSSGSFSFKVKCTPIQANLQQKKGKFLDKLPTIVSSSFCNQNESTQKKKCGQVIVVQSPRKCGTKPGGKGQEKCKKKPKIIDTKWALARINIFDDRSRTFEIMDLKKKIPKGIVTERTVVFFAVLPDGTTCCYDCLGETGAC